MMGMEPAQLFFSFVFGAIGTGYIIYGMKQKKGIPLLAGVIMSIYPAFVKNAFFNLAIGAFLMYLPNLIES